MQRSRGGLGYSRTRAVERLGLLVALLVLAGVASMAMPSSSMAAAPSHVWTDATPADPADSPPALGDASMAFDPAIGELVLFGGYEDVGVSNETWTFDGAEWTQLTTANSPPARYGASMAFDPSTGDIVLFGGYNSDGSPRNETWIFDGTDWTQQTTARSPAARGGASMAFDRSTGEVVLFGGINGNFTALRDTWTFDGTSWTQQSPANSPPARESSSMAFDSSSGEIVLFGGLSGVGYPLRDTWNYDGTNWVQQTPAASPRARFGASMAFDPSIGKVVLFGGSSSGGPIDDTWTYDGADWTQQETATSPPPRGGASIAFDPSLGEIVLFGGSEEGGARGDTWTFGPPANAVSDWTEGSPANSPSGRISPSMVFDSSTGEIVLFGGNTFEGPVADTWTYDGTNWTQQAPANSPSARYGASMVFDPSTGEIVLFGGYGAAGGVLSDTWTYDGTEWTERSTATNPPARFLASMAFDHSTGEIVLFGGISRNFAFLDDTWTFDGTDWTQQLTTTGPSARAGASMAFDPSAGEIVLFGGGVSDPDAPSGLRTFDDTWTYDGAGWTQQTIVARPPALVGASMAFDPSTGVIVLFGGNQNGRDSDSTTWTYDGTGWAGQTTANTPPARNSAAMAFDPSTGEIVLFGGSDGGQTYLDDTWTYGLVAPSAPPANDPPSGSDSTIQIGEDSTKTFAASDFGFSDPNDTPANSLSAVKIATPPTVGTLKLEGAAVIAGDTVSAADIAADKLTYEPAANDCGSAYASFTFQVQDDGGTANGGTDTDQSPNTIAIDVTCVNDAPTDVSLTNSSVAENTPQGTDVGNLSATDPDTPAQTFTYTLVAGAGDTDNSDFQISGTTLEVKNPLDFEAGATRTVRIRVTDSGSPAEGLEKQFTITVTNVNETPPTTPTDPTPPIDPDPPVIPGPSPAPDTTIGNLPKNPKGAHTHFRFRSSIPGSTFTCQLDREEPESCERRINYRELEAGLHKFKVFATSPQGVADPTPAKARFRISE